MNELPDFWRTEIWHPLSVHLPLALLSIGTLLKLFARFILKESFNASANILLLIGTLGAWIAVYTGNMADGAVSRNICDPTMLKDHENAAYIVAWLYTAASALVISDLTGLITRAWNWLRVITILLMITGAGFLLYTGHLGAQLVYQQGAGVYHPSGNCNEFK